MRIKRLAVVSAVLFLIFACTRPPQDIADNFPRSQPLALIVEKVISGYMLGQTLRYPVGLAVDYYGKIYVCDAGNNRLLRLADSLVVEREAGGLGSLEGLFNRPSYIAVDNGLNVVVSDVGNSRLCRHDKDMHFVEAIKLLDPDDPLKFGEPSGLALTDYGEIWMCDSEKNRIAVFNNIGQFSRFVGDFGYSGGQLLHPQKIIRNSRNNFIVCDADNRRLVFYDHYGNFVREIKNRDFSYPVAVVTDKSDNLWVLDGATGTVFYMDEKGNTRFQFAAVLPGAQTAMKNPSDLVFLKDGRLLISDSGNNRLLVCRILVETQ
ncbi:MAG: NHL repeat-containing protein [candidate division Zixibacteria bacterium]|nr:NHL repeat-containing protein [candidate division Zixibacteria bacterium]